MPPHPVPPPTILFGAFDRHNLGDLLFAHIAARLLEGKRLLFAGVVASDLRGVGGFQTRAIAELAKEFGRQPVTLMHVGGEVLTCDAWQAAVMVQAPESVQPLIQRLEGQPQVRLAWASEVLGLTALAPYLGARDLFPAAAHIVYTAAGGVELNGRDEAFRGEVIAKLKDADYVSVRDPETSAYLSTYEVNTHLVPDPAVLVAELFGERIRQHAHTGEVAAVRTAFPRGYLACQFSADFADDATLKVIAAQLEHVATSRDNGVVLFRAGAAPWHDDLAGYRRLAGFIKATPVKIFASLNIWDICAVIAHSSAFCGSSLHGRIVAMAYAVPRVNVTPPQQGSRTGKQAAYAAAWELPGMSHCVEIDVIEAGILQALAADRDPLLIHAQAQAMRYLAEFTTIQALLDTPL